MWTGSLISSDFLTRKFFKIYLFLSLFLPSYLAPTQCGDACLHMDLPMPVSINLCVGALWPALPLKSGQ